MIGDLRMSLVLQEAGDVQREGTWVGLSSDAASPRGLEWAQPPDGLGHTVVADRSHPVRLRHPRR